MRKRFSTFPALWRTTATAENNIASHGARSQQAAALFPPPTRSAAAPFVHAKVPDANGNPQHALLPNNVPRHGSEPALPVNAPVMRSGSQRSMRAWRHASPILYLCATGVSTPLFQNLADCRNGSHIHELLCAIARRTALSRPPQQGASRPATVMEYTSLPESIRESFPAQSTPSSFGQPITVA